MSLTFSAPPPAPAPASRADGPVSPVQPARAVPAVRTETARAPQPAQAPGKGLNLRFQDSAGRPVGPPPAFQVSLLQAMREAALAPERAPGDPQPASVFDPAGAGFPPAMIDRKV